MVPRNTTTETRGVVSSTSPREARVLMNGEVVDDGLLIQSHEENLSVG